MGLVPSAELIWGIPITNEYDDEDRPPRFWNEEADDWDETSGLKIEPFGHYEDDVQRAILSHPSVPSFDGDAWETKKINTLKLDLSARTVHEFCVQVQALVGDEHAREMFGSLGWHLVASYG